MKNAIELQDLSFSYGETGVLEKVNLKITPGQYIGIFGPNGGGKTTFLKLLMGFLKPTSGQILVSGTSPEQARLSMGYVPQNGLFDKQFPLSVLDVVLMGAISHLSWWGRYPPSVKRAAQEKLEQVGLIDMQHRPFGTLSGGQAQRALIARALMNSPKLLFLDEPTASIDSEAEADIYSLLDELKGSMTILMVTHDLQAMMSKVDGALYIHRKVRSLTPAEVCGHFAVGLYHTPISQ
jgi:zinc transport system ATP-binding protein